ncbi:hypothetical protein ACIA8C_25635 [Nocardia sp. NPDC051321]|uniref:hypothetical protein n=1 Tax=Nocardia sp. NPDC051321 TaxID=3364323 RepID=UPI0037A0915F
MIDELYAPVDGRRPAAGCQRVGPRVIGADARRLIRGIESLAAIRRHRSQAGAGPSSNLGSRAAAVIAETLRAAIPAPAEVELYASWSTQAGGRGIALRRKASAALCADPHRHPLASHFFN